MLNCRQTVTDFANALDAEDYGSVLHFLSPTCTYVCRGKKYQGAEAIVQSYQGNGDTAKRFDQVVYESSVEPIADDRFRIRFVDRLTHAESTLTFESDQIVWTDSQGKICRIEHIDLPGMVDALQAFRRQVGV